MLGILLAIQCLKHIILKLRVLTQVTELFISITALMVELISTGFHLERMVQGGGGRRSFCCGVMICDQYLVIMWLWFVSLFSLLQFEPILRENMCWRCQTLMQSCLDIYFVSKMYMYISTESSYKITFFRLCASLFNFICF